MIQRIQSLWLLLAAVAMFLALKLPFAVAKSLESGNTKDITVDEYLIAFLIAILLSVGSLVIIFLFKRRSNQKRLIWLGILTSVLFIVLMYFHVEEYKTNDNNITASFSIGAVFPIVYIIFMAMAYAGVRRDEKLIRSIERLR